ncbi:MAG: CUAEP/CCAEP-tail radical SAM protein [Byssovorax sp.]
MRAPGAILLVSTYELGHQPHVLASALGFLRRAGFEGDALDVSIEPFDEGQAERARFVGISVPMHTALRLALPLVARIRALNPACHICLFGLYGSLNADHLLRAHGVDSVIGGEIEAPLVALIEALNAGDDRPVPGVARLGAPAAPHLARLDFAAPRRDRLPALDRYARLLHQGEERVTGYVEASRGCKHLCLHCPIPPVYGGRFFTIPREIVLDDVRRLVAAGARHLTFGDPDFLNGPTHARKLVQALHQEHPALTYDFTAKVEHVIEHAALFPELARTGCLFFVCAIESSSDTVLANLEKGHTRADIFRALGIARAAGIALRPSLVAFTPWTTLDDYLDLLDVIRDEGLIDHVDPVQHTIRLLVPPGSYLLDRQAIRPHLGALVEAELAYRWTHPDPRMDALHRAVSERVERAIQAEAEEDAAVTFEAVRALAIQARDGSASATEMPAPRVDPHRRKPPRLSEAWFC